MPSLVSSAKVEAALRARLRAEGYKLNATRANGETGVDVLATRRGRSIHIEVIAFKSTAPARSKDFQQSFFRAVSRIKDGASRCAIALPERWGNGLPARAKQYGVAWKRIGDAFPELEIWLVDAVTGYYQLEKWNHWLSNNLLDRTRETVWGFVAKNALFTFRSAWRIERRRQLAKHLPLVRNRFVQQWLLTSIIIGVFVIIGGAWALILFIAEAAFGLFTTEYVNYAQHYGLSREADAPPRGSLSWNSNGFTTNAFTLNITRHVDHHLRADVPYYDLKHIDSMPLLPGGYLALFLPAMIPLIWRRLMDARAQQFATSPL
jgi:Fatty acid desaturase